MSKQDNLSAFIEVEFPSVRQDGKFYSLDLERKLDCPTYKKFFLIKSLSYHLCNGSLMEGCCFAEMWIIKHNSMYDYLWKKEQITL